MKRSTLFLLLFLFTLPLTLVWSQTDWEWDFYPSLERPQATLEANGELWITFGTSILQINTVTKETTLHNHRTIQADTGTERDYKETNLHGLWKDKNDKINVFMDNNTGYISWDGNQWAFNPLSDMEFLKNDYSPQVIRQDSEDNLIVISGYRDIYSWNPLLNPSEAHRLTDTLGMRSERYIYDNTDRLWAYSNYNLGEVYRKDGTTISTINIPGPSEVPVITHVTKHGEIWAWREQGVYYFDTNDQWLQLPFDPGNDFLYPHNLLPLTAQKAYLVDQGKTFLLEVHDNQLTATAVTVLNQETARVNRLLACTENGDVYYLGGTDNSLWRISLREERPEKIASLKAAPSRFFKLATDTRDELWGIASFKDIYSFTGGRWEKTNHLFPGVPEQPGNIAFTDQYAPIVTHYIEGEYVLSQWMNGQWKERSSPENNPFPIGTNNHQLYLDHKDQLWVFDGLGISHWQYGQWWRDNLSEYFPRSSTRINDFHVDNQSRLFITADRQLIIRDGGYYESYSLEDLGFAANPSANGFSYLSSDVDKEGNLYLAHKLEVRRWTEEGTVAMHPFDEIIENPTTYDSTYAGASEIFSFAKDDIWVIFSKSTVGLDSEIIYTNGIAHFNGINWSAFYPTNSPLSNYTQNIYDIAKDASGRIWISTDKGLDVITRNNRSRIKLYEPLQPNQLNIYPNPGCCAFQLHWEQPNDGMTTINLLDIQGVFKKEIKTSYLFAGPQSWPFTRDNLPAGTYFVQVVTGEKTFIEKVIIL